MTVFLLVAHNVKLIMIGATISLLILFWNISASKKEVAINVSSPDIQLNDANNEVLKHLIKCAKEISTKFGNRDYFETLDLS